MVIGAGIEAFRGRSVGMDSGWEHFPPDAEGKAGGGWTVARDENAASTGSTCVPNCCD